MIGKGQDGYKVQAKKEFIIQNRYRAEKGAKALTWSDELYRFALYRLRYYPEINAEEAAIQKIRELVENLQDVEIVGKIPENISTERIIRGFDPKGEIYNNEVSLRSRLHK